MSFISAVCLLNAQVFKYPEIVTEIWIFMQSNSLILILSLIVLESFGV